MTCNITATPLELEPLPLYRRDPETSSVLSSAPSYASEAPTYHSRRPSIPAGGASPQIQQQPQPYYINTSLLDISSPPRSRSDNHGGAHNNPDATSGTNEHSRSHSSAAPSQGLPAPRYAPGFQSRASGNVSEAELLQNYNIGAWSSVTNSHARRQYERVAMRRASRAAGSDRTKALIESMSMGGENPPPHLLPSLTGADKTGIQSPTSSSPPSRSRASTPPLAAGQAGADTRASSNAARSGTASANASTSNVSSATSNNASTSSSPLPSEPVSPLEDPALVGEAAAARARQQRLYREACLRHDHATRQAQESKSWDFMLSQMADWEERERSWGRFRTEVEARQGRIGAMGVGIGRLGGFAIGDGPTRGGKRWSFGGRGRLGSR